MCPQPTRLFILLAVLWTSAAFAQAPPAPAELDMAETQSQDEPPAPPVLLDPETSPEPLPALEPELELEPERPAAPPSPTDEATPAAHAADALPGFIDGLAEGLRREHALAGLGLAVVRSGRPPLLLAYGQADLATGREVDPERSLFRIGSVSKTFIWTLAMMLAERGQLDLDADVNGYLKSVTVAPAFGAPVTMRDLMHHRAGFEDSVQVFSVGDDDPRPLAQLLAAHQPRRVYPPGARTSYSNWGSALAAQVLEDAAGRPYEDLLRAELLEPLGMRDTDWSPPARLEGDRAAQLAIGYRPHDGGLGAQAYMQLGAYWPAGGMLSSPADMARWISFHLGGGELDGVRLLSPQMHARLFSRGFTDRPLGADLAHGFQDRPFRGQRVLGHGGATSAYLANLMLVPEQGLGVFIAQNSGQSRSLVYTLPEQILEHALGLSPPAVLYAGERAEAGALADVAGTYLNNRRVFSSFTAVFAAFSPIRVEAVSADTLLLHQGERPQRFRRVAEDVFESAGGQRVAVLRDGGSVVGLADGSGVHSLERVGWFGNPLSLLAGFALSLLFGLFALFGALWRLGRTRSGGAVDAIAVGAGLIGAVSVLALLVCGLLLAVAMDATGPADLVGNYPLPQMLWMHYAGWAQVIAAGLMLLTLAPVWTSSRLGLLRRLGYSLFTVSMVFLAIQLWHWRVIGAAVV
ncbi:MAG: beta-lactamase family protein [Aquimonas sp.]|nr:beta-lactamase family protein [Aquimonas sp.]